MKILSIDDHLAIAKSVHKKLGGKIGLSPIFRMVQWLDARMGLNQGGRRVVVGSLLFQAQQESEGGERTVDAISFDAVAENFQAAVQTIEEAITKARGQ